MRVICPNCEQRGLIDVAALSEVPVSTLCPRCDAPFRISLHDDIAPRALHATIAPPVIAPPVIEKVTHGVSSGAAGDVLVLPRVESRAALLEVPTCTVLDLDEELSLRRAPARPRVADDTYRVAARFLNASPLWILVAGFAFISLAVLCDRLLAADERAGANAATVASLENQATNRAASRGHALDDSQKDDTQAVGYSDAEPSAAEDSDEIKPAPISDPVVPRADANAPVVAASFKEAREDLSPAATEGEQVPVKLTLQLASYRSEEEAQELAAKLQEAGFEARVVAQQNSKRPWYCVQTKVFDTREDAEQHLAELRAKHFASSYTVREVD
jgi:cell division septation protein DedD